MRLVDFIHAHPNEIEHEWEEFAKTLPAAASGLSVSTLRDNLREILQAIVDDMEVPESTEQQTEKSQGKSPEGGALDRITTAHAGRRLDSGFDLEHAIGEYRALRASVLRLWSRSGPTPEENSVDDVTRFNETIDQGVAAVLGRYSRETTKYSDRFVGILAHDVRTPLNLITLAATGLLGDGQQERRARNISWIFGAVRRIERLVDDMAILVRSRMGTPLPLVKGNADLGDICGNASIEVQASHGQVSFALERIGDLNGNWDGERLIQMVSNLLVNAVVHAYGEEVRIVAQGDGPDVSLKVSNKGAPISPEIMDSIFEPLMRGGGTPDSLSTGLGLGLFIVKQIVTAHQGTVEVTSTASEGTMFTVRLPRIAD